MASLGLRLRRKLATSALMEHLGADPEEHFAGGPRVRPAHWAQPLIGTSIGNLHQVDADLYRSAHPQADDLPDLLALGIRTIVNLREYHEDEAEFAAAGIGLVRFELATGSVQKHLVPVLCALRDLPKPILVHCWHGSDRTGFLVAGYRMVFQNWSNRDAAEEFALGGYGYHAKVYPHILKHLLALDPNALRQQLALSPVIPYA